MLRGALFLCLLLCGGLTTRAQDTLVAAPTNTVEIRPFDAQRIARYQADPELQYDRERELHDHVHQSVDQPDHERETERGPEITLHQLVGAA